MEYAGNPENRTQLQPLSYGVRHARYANCCLDVEGTGQRNRGADPATLSTGGSGNVPRAWVDAPYNANARSRNRWAGARYYRERGWYERWSEGGASGCSSWNWSFDRR